MQTSLGKLVVVFGLLAFVFIIVPFAIQRVSARIADIRSQLNSFTGDHHLLLSVPDGTVMGFLTEYFIPRSIWAPRVAILMSSKELTPTNLRSNAELRLRTWIYEGDLISNNLERGNASGAWGAVLLAPKIAPQDIAQFDAATILSVTSLRQMNPTCPIFVQLFHLEHALLLRRLPGVEVLDISDSKATLMALAVKIKGIIPLLGNLTTSIYPAMKTIGKKDKTSWKYEIDNSDNSDITPI